MEMHFHENYDDNDLFLIEVPPNLCEYIENNGELLIKGSEPTILCTHSKSYELKYLETSNTYLLFSTPRESIKKEIALMTFHTLECNDYAPRKYNVYNLLKNSSALAYDINDGGSNFEKLAVKYTLEECFAMSELSFEDFQKSLDEFLIFEKCGVACIFEENFLNDILYYVLRALSLDDYDSDKDITISCDEIYSKLLQIRPQYEKIVHNLSQTEKNILLRYIFIQNPKDTASFTLDVAKAKLFIAKNIFLSKKGTDFRLDEYITILNSSFQVCFPMSITNKITDESNNYILQTSCQDNIFEYYKGYDLRFLIGYCLIHSLKTHRDPLIKWVEMAALPDKYDERVVELFKMKEKWTIKELQLFLSDLGLPNLHEKLGRCTQTVGEVNPFDREKQVTYYFYKKNPMFKNYKI